MVRAVGGGALRVRGAHPAGVAVADLRGVVAVRGHVAVAGDAGVVLADVVGAVVRGVQLSHAWLARLQTCPPEVQFAAVVWQLPTTQTLLMQMRALLYSVAH